MAKLSAQLQRGDNVGVLSSADFPEDGDEREYFWQGTKAEAPYTFVRVERFFAAGDDSGWREVYFSRTRVGGPASNSD